MGPPRGPPGTPAEARAEPLLRIEATPSRYTCGRAGAFTLVELLVAIAVIAMLIAVLLPALRMSISTARQFRCQVSLRSVGFDFSVFADETLHGDRGDDEYLNGRFRLETFQESEYGISEFWRWGDTDAYSFPDNDKNDPMRCSEMRGEIVVRRGTPCRSGAVSPPENISFGFNGRLDRAPRAGSPRWNQVDLSSHAVDQPTVPLAWDVDGERARRQGVEPVFSAPALDAVSGPFVGGRYWFPGTRHNGGLNVLLLDQSVHATKRPLDERWDWSYLPPR